MRCSAKLFAIGIALVITSVLFPKHASAQQGEVSFQVFYDDLSPYGQWVDYAGYGYVWVPTEGPDFVPYSSAGHWVWSDYGWTWVSDYNWGWAPFHYGRWDHDDYYGWFWMPDNEWGPAWVSWRRSSGYYGWAPLGPHVSIDVSFGGGYAVPNDRWVFVQEQYLGRRDIHNYYGPRNNNAVYINNSTVINNTYVDNSRRTTYISGPKREEVEKVTGAPVRQVTVKESSKPGQSLNNNELNIYRPAIVKREDAKPAKIAEKKDVQPANERKANAQTAPAKNNMQTGKQNINREVNQANPQKGTPAQKANRPVQVQPGNTNRKTSVPQNSNNTPQAQPNEKVQRPAAQPQAQPVAPRSEQHRSQPNHTQPARPSPQQQPREPMRQPAPRVEHPQSAPAPERTQPAPRPQPQPQSAPHQQPQQSRPAPGQRPH